MVEIYVSSCSTCGVDGVYVRRVKNAHPEAVVYNSKYEADKRAEHLAYLEQLGITPSEYVGIVVIDGGVTLLREF